MQAVPLSNGGKQRRNNTVCVDGENRPNDKKIVWTTKPKCSKSQRCAILTIETFFIGKNRAEFKSFRLFCMLSLDWKFKKHIKNEQKNPILHFVFVAGIGSFSGFCAAESRHDLHLPVRSAEGHVLRALEWQWHGTCPSVGMYRKYCCPLKLKRA